MQSPTRPSILVVEDDPTMAWMLMKALEHLAPVYLIQGCRDGLEALAYVMQHPVSCVLTNYMMPRMNGITLGEILAYMRPTLPVLLISGMPLAELQRLLHEHTTNFVTILEKPFALTDLQVALRPLLAAHDPPGDERHVAA